MGNTYEFMKMGSTYEIFDATQFEIEIKNDGGRFYKWK